MRQKGNGEEKICRRYSILHDMPALLLVGEADNVLEGLYREELEMYGNIHEKVDKESIIEKRNTQDINNGGTQVKQKYKDTLE